MSFCRIAGLHKPTWKPTVGGSDKPAEAKSSKPAEQVVSDRADGKWVPGREAVSSKSASDAGKVPPASVLTSSKATKEFKDFFAPPRALKQDFLQTTAILKTPEESLSPENLEDTKVHAANAATISALPDKAAVTSAKPVLADQQAETVYASLAKKGVGSALYATGGKVMTSGAPKTASNPTKSPSTGMHKPTWKPSSKPNERRVLSKTDIGPPRVATPTMTPKTNKPAEHRVLAKESSLKSLKTAMKGDKAALKEADADIQVEIKTDLKAVKKEIHAETEIKQLKADIKTEKKSLATADAAQKTALKTQIKDAKTAIKADKEVVVNEETGRPYGLDADGEVHSPAKGTKLGQVEGTVVEADLRKDSKDAPTTVTATVTAEEDGTATIPYTIPPKAAPTETTESDSIPYTIPPKAAPTETTEKLPKDKTLTPPTKGSKMGQKTAVAADEEETIPYTIPPKAAPTETTDATETETTTVVKKPSVNDPLRASELDGRRLNNKHVQKEVELTKDEIKAMEKLLETMDKSELKEDIASIKAKIKADKKLKKHVDKEQKAKLKAKIADLKEDLVEAKAALEAVDEDEIRKTKDQLAVAASKLDGKQSDKKDTNNHRQLAGVSRAEEVAAQSEQTHSILAAAKQILEAEMAGKEGLLPTKTTTASKTSAASKTASVPTTKSMKEAEDTVKEVIKVAKKELKEEKKEIKEVAKEEKAEEKEAKEAEKEATATKDSEKAEKVEKEVEVKETKESKKEAKLEDSIESKKSQDTKVSTVKDSTKAADAVEETKAATTTTKADKTTTTTTTTVVDTELQAQLKAELLAAVAEMTADKSVATSTAETLKLASAKVASSSSSSSSSSSASKTATTTASSKKGVDYTKSHRALAGSPTKSPSTGMHKPTWKPSSKPAEHRMLKQKNDVDTDRPDYPRPTMKPKTTKPVEHRRLSSTFKPNEKKTSKPAEKKSSIGAALPRQLKSDPGPVHVSTPTMTPRTSEKPAEHRVLSKTDIGPPRVATPTMSPKTNKPAEHRMLSATFKPNEKKTSKPAEKKSSIGAALPRQLQGTFTASANKNVGGSAAGLVKMRSTANVPPSKSPSAGMHKPSWKPSSKPAESLNGMEATSEDVTVA